MTVLVTGGAGYIGSHMALDLLDCGEKTVVLDNLSTGFRWAVPDGVGFVQGDFGDAALVSDLLKREKIDAVAHFAAKVVVPESVADPLAYYDNNVAKARTLIECAVRAGVRHFVFSSTAAVYGDPQANPVSEDQTLNPVSPYGRSKLMVEWMLEDAARAHDFRYVVLRYFNVCGADPSGRSGQSTKDATHLIKVAVQTALGVRPMMKVFGADYPTPDGTCLRDYIQVSDLVRAHRDALAHLRMRDQCLTCNVGYQRGYSVLEVIAAVKRVAGVDFPVEIAARRPGDPAAIVAANARVRQAFAWSPRYDDLDEIVRQALDWERRLHNRAAV